MKSKTDGKSLSQLLALVFINYYDVDIGIGGWVRK